MTTNRNTSPQIPIKDIYSMDDVRAMLHVSERRIREFISRLDDPLPFRCLQDSKRGMFIECCEFREWVMRNTVFASVRIHWVKLDSTQARQSIQEQSDPWVAETPTVKVPDIKVEGENTGNALFVMRLVHQPVLPQDAYSVGEIAKLLGVKPIKVYRYAKDAVNPLPLRK